MVTDSFAVYADTTSNGLQLSSLVRQEVREFEDRFGIDVPGFGIILAIEQDQDPSRELNCWRAAHCAVKRQIVWTDSHGGTIYANDGRPYCFFQKYFQQSFPVPVADLRELADQALPPSSRIGWCCALATDAYVRSSFATQMCQARAEQQKEELEVPALVRLLSLPGSLIMKSAWVYLFRKCLVLDIKLSRLKARETVWASFFNAAIQDRNSRRTQLDALRSEIDNEWKKIWMQRPVE